LSEESTKKLVSAQFNVMTKSAYSVELVQKMREDGLANTRSLLALLGDISTIKVGIGEKNVDTGVTQKLSELEVINRKMKFLKSIIDGSEGKISYSSFDNINVSEAASVKNLYQSATLFNVSVLQEEDIERFKNDLIAQRKIASKLTDDIADLNRSKMELEISDEGFAAADL
jgi:hypothetical protein